MPVQKFGRLSQKLFTVMDQEQGPINFHDFAQRWTLDAIGINGFGMWLEEGRENGMYMCIHAWFN